MAGRIKVEDGFIKEYDEYSTGSGYQNFLGEMLWKVE
jgi:hypothetical protein